MNGDLLRRTHDRLDKALNPSLSNHLKLPELVGLLDRISRELAPILFLHESPDNATHLKNVRTLENALKPRPECLSEPFLVLKTNGPELIGAVRFL